LSADLSGEAGRDYDVVVIGSGFGGSVTALRLSEKGYRVGVLEAGRRFADDEFARTSWDLRRFLWAPRLGCFGIQRIHRLPHVTVLAGAGVGGGSLVYANTLYEPHDAFYDDPAWRDIADWRAELAPYYELAKQMLGVVTNPSVTASDEAMRTVAEEMGVGHTFRLTPVGVFFGAGAGETVPDPYFGGAGPARTGCFECGACMTGCRYGAKNTLPKNYLWLAERAGARVHPLSTVVALRPLPDGGYAVDSVRTGAWRPAATRRTFTASQVVLAAGALGTQRLLHRMKDDGVLSRLSPRLGSLTRTNSESLVGAWSRRRAADFSRGVAITSSFHPTPDTHVEPVRYGRGSNAMGLLSTLLTDGGGRSPRVVRWLGAAARRLARVIDGEPGGNLGDLFGAPMTAHFIGGAPIGATPESGVLDAWHRVFGYDGVHVVDGTALSANLGANPSLTITAQAERAMAFWPNQGEPDPRPPLSSPYVRLEPVPARRPAVRWT
jgi:cholesterol oxidase